MSSRNERRRRARQAHQAQASHGDKMMAYVVKARESRQTAHQQDGFHDLYQYDKAVKPPLDLEALVRLSEESAIHAACIEAKVADSVGRGWGLEPEDDTEEGASTDHEQAERQLRDLLTGLCQDLTFDGMLRQMTRELLATGWGCWEVARDGNEIAALYPLPAHTLRATRDEDVFVQIKGERKVYFARFGCEQDVDVETGEKGDIADEARRGNEVLIVRSYSPRTPYYGIPAWVSAVPAIAEMASIREFNVSWFSSGGQSDRSIHVTSADATTAEKLATSVKEQLESGRGVGHTSLVTFGDDSTSLSISQLSQESGKRDGQFMRRREDLVKEILIAHQTPPYRVGWAEQGSLGGNAAKEMLDAYRFGTVEPLQELVEAKLNATLFGEMGLPIPGMKFTLNDLTVDERAANAEVAVKAVDAAVATPNEARSMIGLPRVSSPEMDAVYYKGAAVSGQPPQSPDMVAEEQTAKQFDALAELRDAISAALALDTPGESGDPEL